MAATTISRATITDDSGNGTSGTILNAAWVGTAIYDKIDSIFNNAGLTTWEANVAGVVGVRAANTNTGTSGFAELGAANSSGTLLRMRHFGTGFTTSGANVQSRSAARRPHWTRTCSAARSRPTGTSSSQNWPPILPWVT